MWFVRRACTVFLCAAGAARARCIIAQLLEPALVAALNQLKRAWQTGFLHAVLTAAVGDDLRDLSQIRQEPTEIVHHYWARFLLVMNMIEDCREEDAISFFCNNCTNIGILNAISHCEITCFANLASIV